MSEAIIIGIAPCPPKKLRNRDSRANPDGHGKDCIAKQLRRDLIERFRLLMDSTQSLGGARRPSRARCTPGIPFKEIP